MAGENHLRLVVFLHDKKYMPNSDTFVFACVDANARGSIVAEIVHLGGHLLELSGRIVTVASSRTLSKAAKEWITRMQS